VASISSNLALAIAGATAVRVTRVADFDPRERASHRPIVVVSDLPSLERLRGCLAIDRASLEEKHSWMTPGDVDLNFLAGHELLATVTYLSPTYVRWRRWGSDARLEDPRELAAWLVEQGWRSPERPK
jgi:hypothetical protein